MTLGVLCLLLGLNEPGTLFGWITLAASAILFSGLFWVERRAAEPLLPLAFFRDRLFTVSIVHGVLAGWAMFGSLNYVPLFVQAVLGTSATQAGIALTPMSLSWTLASIFGSPLLLRIGYRTLALAGMVLLVTGTALMTGIGVGSSQISVMVFTGLMGIGMGLSVPAFLIAVQSTVRKEQLGAATSAVQFSRSIGGTLGVSIMGVVLSARLASLLVAAGINPGSISLNALIDPLASVSANLILEVPLRAALGVAIANLFVIALVSAVAGLLVVLAAPRGRISELKNFATDVQEKPLTTDELR
jgi:predicted MFS family arabinose efflux permease